MIKIKNEKLKDYIVSHFKSYNEVIGSQDQRGFNLIKKEDNFIFYYSRSVILFRNIYNRSLIKTIQFLNGECKEPLLFLNRKKHKIYLKNLKDSYTEKK